MTLAKGLQDNEGGPGFFLGLIASGSADTGKRQAKEKWHSTSVHPESESAGSSCSSDMAGLGSHLYKLTSPL